MVDAFRMNMETWSAAGDGEGGVPPASLHSISNLSRLLRKQSCLPEEGGAGAAGAGAGAGASGAGPAGRSADTKL